MRYTAASQQGAVLVAAVCVPGWVHSGESVFAP